MFILAFITDFFFQAKVSETAKQVGVPIKLVTTRSKFDLELENHPSLVVVDLSASGEDTPTLIAHAKAEVPDISVVAFGAHVDGELLNRASEAGARALSRSSFSSQLPEILGLARPLQ